MNTMVIRKDASVVEYSYARRILYALGYGAVREADFLNVFEKRTSSSLYTNNGGGCVAKLAVDEGGFCSCLTEDGSLSYNQPWVELVDFRQLLWIIVKRYSPAFTPAPCEYIGRGRTQEHYIAESLREIKRLEEESPESELFQLFKFV